MEKSSASKGKKENESLLKLSKVPQEKLEAACLRAMEGGVISEGGGRGLRRGRRSEASSSEVEDGAVGGAGRLPLSALISQSCSGSVSSSPGHRVPASCLVMLLDHSS